MAEKEWRSEDVWAIPDGESCVYTDPEYSDKVEAVYKETTKHAEVEEESVCYCICRDPKDPSLFYFFERHKSKEIFQQHKDQEIIFDPINSGWIRNVKRSMLSQ